MEKKVKNYFLDQLEEKQGFSPSFDFLINGEQGDILEIITEDTKRYDLYCFDKLNQLGKTSLNLKDLGITRWSKQKYRITRLTHEERIRKA